MRWILLLLLAGCAERVVVKTEKEPILVLPACEPPNSFEKCKAFCMASGKKVTMAQETESEIHCVCGLWES